MVDCDVSLTGDSAGTSSSSRGKIYTSFIMSKPWQFKLCIRAFRLLLRVLVLKNDSVLFVFRKPLNQSINHLISSRESQW
jgi:hypothetical protein